MMVGGRVSRSSSGGSTNPGPKKRRETPTIHRRRLSALVRKPSLTGGAFSFSVFSSARKRLTTEVAETFHVVWVEAWEISNGKCGTF
jgi:hypothetical protein